MSVLIWVQTVCKRYQQRIKVAASKESLPAHEGLVNAVMEWATSLHIMYGGYKTFFMLNSTELEIYHALCQNANICWHFNIY